LSYCIRSRRRPRPTLFPYTTLFRSIGPPTWLSTIFVSGKAEASSANSRICGWNSHPSNERSSGASRAKPSRNPVLCIRSFGGVRSEEHTSELQSRENLVCRLLLEKQ